MKTIFFIIALSLSSTSFAQKVEPKQNKTKMANNIKNSIYQSHKIQLMDQEKFAENERKKNGVISDNINNINNMKSEVEVVDFSSGKPLKIK